MTTRQQFFDQLNQEYLNVHKTKEDLFWSTYMGTSHDDEGFSRAEQDYKAFISDPERLEAVRAHLESLQASPENAETQALIKGLQGWKALFECNILDTPEARKHMADLIEMESRLFSAARDFVVTHVNEKGEREEASLGMLSTNLGTNPDEASRKSSHDAFLAIEQWVLNNGFLPIIEKRNALARSMGYRDFFEYKVQKNEQMSVEALFGILDDFESRTRTTNENSLRNIAEKHGASALLGHNLRFHMSGDVARQLDPYFPFAQGLERWISSFRRLGITYRGALLQLDLLERKGKYQNGFCHGPVPTYFDGKGQWVAGQINFTAEAKPDQIGSGARALNTLFHEGGHAAHFANVTQNAPCFSQEFPPTSMAYAETQSMFCDSLLDDADWLKRYARNAAGDVIPDALIEAKIRSGQPFRAYGERSILVVPYFERQLYAMTDGARTPAAVTALARECEKRILGVEVGPRPLMAIPHLQNQESAAAYHGYLLANMAVYQTRAYFQRQFGYLTDNPAIGPLLAEHYWAPGNSISHNDTLLRLTGEGFSAQYLADVCNQSTDDAWREAQRAMRAAAERQYSETFPQSLCASIQVVHGELVIADNQQGDDALCRCFEAWVGEHFPGALGKVAVS